MPDPAPAELVRFEAARPTANGRHPGIFALLRGLRESGRLDERDAAHAAELVARSYALHVEPAPEHFRTDPPALSWFRTDVEPAERATALRALADDVVALLRSHGIACREVRSTDPGRITYSDDVQVVAVPPSTARPA